MKRIYSLLVFFLFNICLVANAYPVITLIKGTINRDKATSMVLFDVQYGEKIEYASTRIGTDNQFAFAMPSLQKGYYYLTDQRRRDFIRIYLKPGDKINLQIDEDKYELREASSENKLLKQWTDVSYPVTKMSIFPRKDSATYKSFFPALR